VYKCRVGQKLLHHITYLTIVNSLPCAPWTESNPEGGISISMSFLPSSIAAWTEFWACLCARQRTTNQFTGIHQGALTSTSPLRTCLMAWSYDVGKLAGYRRACWELWGAALACNRGLCLRLRLLAGLRVCSAVAHLPCMLAGKASCMVQDLMVQRPNGASSNLSCQILIRNSYTGKF
jgi:hypothetical protein